MNMDFDKGRQLFINDQYLTVRKIGHGGFGIVWKAYDFSLRNFVTIKQLLPEFTEPKFIEMFYKEALIAKNMIHDNIVRVQHFWKGSNDAYYIVMDYVSGEDLESLMRICNEQKTPLPWELAVLIAEDILKAIDYANRVAKDPITGRPYGIVYRDLSPGNVLISFEGNIKISDFGIAKTADDISCGIKQRIVTGKYAYMSPEQIMCDPEIDHRSDIFSVGIVLYEMLAGKPLFRGTADEIKKQVLETKFDSSLFAETGIPEDLAEIVSKALEKKKDDRYEKAIEMFRDMRRLLKSKETEDLIIELSNFLTKLSSEQYNNEKEYIKLVKQLDIPGIKADNSVLKLSCRDFIMGEEPKVREPEEIPQSKEISEESEAAAEKEETWVQPERAPEEKGKTVFEEVGDWFIKKFVAYKKMIIRLIAAFFVSIVIFGVLDTFFQISPFGKYAFSFLYPPDVIITTVPSGALVSLKTREGKIIISGKDSTQPIKLRKIPPKTYILSGLKKGFKPAERVVRIEGPEKGVKKKMQQLELLFDFMLRVNADVEGAEIYIDGNKVGISSWTGTITSGEHTVKLSAPGFEDLGSVAKESKEGQCSLDFTKATTSEIFENIDTRYWKYDMINENENTVFTLAGQMIKKVTVNSVPQKMVLHIQNESRDRGKTPIQVPLVSGEYMLRLMDPDGRYAETTAKLVVGKGSPDFIKVSLKKWVTVKIKAKGASIVPFSTTVFIKGPDVNIKSDVSTTKPLRVALIPNSYRFFFQGSKEYEPVTTKPINILEQSVVTAEMQYKKVPLRVLVRDSETRNPIPMASIWGTDRLLGETDSSGKWESLIEYGTTTLSVIAKGYFAKTVTEYISPSEKKDIEVDLSTETVVSVSSDTIAGKLAEFKNSLEDVTSSVGNAVETTVIMPTGRSVSDVLTKNIGAVVKKSTETIKTTTVVCPNCGQTYTFSSDKKIRFCTNCGKALRQ